MNNDAVYDNLPLVSVSIITYNHVNYIAQAIESVLMQEVTFPLEIIIGDDNSTDGTQEILKKYKEKYPKKIHLILHPKDYDNIPGRVNNITNLYACRGKYIAMLDGDDFWNSKDKLQKQVLFLEKNPSYALTFHHTDLLRPGNIIERFDNVKTKLKNGTLDFTHADIIKEWFIQTSSMVFVNKGIKEFPAWFWEVYSADYSIQLLVTSYGKVRYFPDITMTRRFHDQSFTANKNINHHHLRIKEITIFGKYFKPYSAYKAKELANYFLCELKKSFRESKFSLCTQYSLKVMKYSWIYFFFAERSYANKKRNLRYLKARSKILGI